MFIYTECARPNINSFCWCYCLKILFSCMVLIIFFKITEHTYLCLFILWADPLLFIFIFFLRCFVFFLDLNPIFQGWLMILHLAFYYTLNNGNSIISIHWFSKLLTYAIAQLSFFYSLICCFSCLKFFFHGDRLQTSLSPWLLDPD